MMRSSLECLLIERQVQETIKKRKRQDDIRQNVKPPINERPPVNSNFTLWE
jgi:hypothetical protein